MDVDQLDPLTLVRVESPDAPDALVRSATGSVVAYPPPPGVRWTWEPAAHPDGLTAEEGLVALNAHAWHDRGIDGSGVVVAVFDIQFYGAHLDGLQIASTHDCVHSPTCELPFDPLAPIGGTDTGIHGAACAEVVRAVAPGADLHLVRVTGRTSLENGIDWAIRNDVDVISMSLSFFNQSFNDGSGPINAAVAKARAAGIEMVVSSGNSATGHRIDAWHDGDGDGRLDVDGTNGLWIYLPSGSTTAYVSWNQYHDCGATDLDAYIRDPETGAVLGSGTDLQSTRDPDHCEPAERVSARTDAAGWYRLEVYYRSGSQSQLTVRTLVPDGDVSPAMPGGSLADPASSPDAFTVGAVRADGYLDNPAERFSSRGPTTDGRYKPDIAGPDGLSTEAYGGLGFYGTSASTPAVAGALALVMSEDPELTPHEAAQRLQALAIADVDFLVKPDPDLGAGRAHLPADAQPQPCGRRPLLLPLFLVPLGWLRSRLQSRRSRRDARCQG